MTNIRRISFGASLVLGAMMFVGSGHAAEQKHLRLVDRLDRPSDGYCIDIPGTPGSMRLEVPLFAHNCKAGLTADSAVVFTAKGRVRFPAVDRCVTAAGVNSTILPNTALILRGCGRNAPFFETAALQSFELRANGHLVLKGSNLCLTVGAVSSRTYSPADRWRALYLTTCGSVPEKYARWELVDPPR